MENENNYQETPSILIVDDDATNLRLLGNILKKENYQISLARSGHEALTMTANFVPDLILLDILMPDMNGIEVCKQIKNSPETREVPIIFLTAKTRIEDFVKGFKVGAADYVTKPFNSSELLARVTTQLELKQTRNAIVRMNDMLEAEIKAKQQAEKDKEELAEEMKSVAITDDLTELYSYIYVTERLTQEISEATRYSHNLSVIMFDIDQLGMINEKYGRPTGDEVLVKVAFTIINELREVDIVGRYGGEEFLVILPNTNIEDCGKTAERVRKSIEQIIWYHGGLKVTLSGGICETKGEDAPELIAKAERLLQKAKSMGRNCIASEEPPGA